MIPADRFIASKHIDEQGWHAARRLGVTATGVAQVAGKKDRALAIQEWLHPEPFDGNAYTEFGNEQEAGMLAVAHGEYGILPSDWLIAGDNLRHLATPDGLSLDHRFIAEAKTTGDPWEAAIAGKLTGVPIKYRRQVQFQMHVTGAERCLFLWQHRIPEGAWFRCAWFTPKTLWIDRDPLMITDLVSVADDMLAARDERSAA